MRHVPVSVAAVSAACFAIGASSHSAVIHVPETVPSIKAAVSMAVNGDEIIVSPATWTGANNRDIHLAGKELWIHSAAGASSCVIDGGGLGRAFILDGGEAEGTIIQGFTFKSCRALGFYQTGGAILTAATSTLAVKDCVFDSNITDLNGRGGAIRVKGGTAFVQGSTLVQNVVTNAASGGGGGISVLAAGAAVVNNSIIWANTTAGATGQLAQISVASGGSLAIAACCAESLDGSLGGLGNFAYDPLFTTMLGADGVKGTIDDDLRPLAASPCVEGGSNALVPLGSVVDLDGFPRIIDGIVDAADLGVLLGAWTLGL